jgi:hypothetical protein
LWNHSPRRIRENHYRDRRNYNRQRNNGAHSHVVLLVTGKLRLQAIPVKEIRRRSGRPVYDLGHTFFLCAVGAAEQNAVLVFGPMPEDSASAVVACRRQRMDRAFETVKSVSRPGHRHFKGLIVVVATHFTDSQPFDLVAHNSSFS